MRLLDTRSLEVVNVFDDSIPEYAILSHTWSSDKVSFHELGGLARDWQKSYEHERDHIAPNKRLAKVIGAANLAAQNGYSYIWMDTCCIDKSSSAELSEAINSMYRWYEEAAVCYVYLSDVQPSLDKEIHDWQGSELERSNFRGSRWFTRGWTLQELIAPSDVRFYAQNWTYIGSHKQSTQLLGLLSSITGVDDRVLTGSLSPQDLSVSTRMKWAALRRTTRTEDVAYCLMGIFGVNMPLLYGEGRRAFIRLQEEILKETDDQSLFAWTSEINEGDGTDRLCGLLAESPFAFKDAGNVRPLPPDLTRDSVPSSITNQGLRIQLYLALLDTGRQNSVEEEYHAILDCSLREGNREYCPSLYLRRLWGDQFARVRPQDCVSVVPPTDNVSLRDRGYQTVFVKQRPVYIMPEFTLPVGDFHPADASTGKGDYLIRAVHPPNRWDWNSFSLKSVYSQIGGVMGVFRFMHSEHPEEQVDIAVGLRRVNQKSWESWCAQERCQGESLDRVFHNFDTALRNINQRVKPQERMFPYEATHGHSIQILSTARVIETQIHGRTYITLQVMKKPELYPATELTLVKPTSRISASIGIPESISTGIATEIEDEICQLTMAGSIEDEIDLSIFPTPELTTRVRTNAYGTTRIPCIKQLENLIALIGPSQLKVRDLKMKMSQEALDLSAELLYACKMGDATQVERLVKTEAAIEAATENFNSFRAIHWAAVSGNLKIIRMLVAAGAMEYSATSQNMTVIHLAVMMGHPHIMEYFFKKAENTGVLTDNLVDLKTKGTLETPLHLAAAYSSPSVARKVLGLLCTFGADRNPAISSGNYLDETPLHRAAAMNNFETVTYLLHLGVDVNEADQFGRTPVWHAACAGASNVLRVLAKNGALLDLADDIGRTPLVVACRGGRVGTVRALLELGARPDVAAQPLGMTACHYAALFGHSDCLRLLINYANAHAMTSQWVYFRPIHLAAANGWLKCVEDLCAAGCDSESYSTHYIVLNSNGTGVRLVARQTQSAEEIAVLRGHVDVAQFLRDRKANRRNRPSEMSLGSQLKDCRKKPVVVDIGTLQGYQGSGILSSHHEETP